MARKYSELRNKMRPEARERARALATRDLLEMDLAELRTRVAGLTQTQVAELLESTQAAISQLEKREDALLSTLAEYVHALGGELELIARFDKKKLVRITQFERVKEQIREGAA